MVSYEDLQRSCIAKALVQGLIDYEWLCGFPMLLALLAQRYVAREMEEWLYIHVRGVIKAA